MKQDINNNNNSNNSAAKNDIPSLEILYLPHPPIDNQYRFRDLKQLDEYLATATKSFKITDPKVIDDIFKKFEKDPEKNFQEFVFNYIITNYPELRSSDKLGEIFVIQDSHKFYPTIRCSNLNIEEKNFHKANFATKSVYDGGYSGTSTYSFSSFIIFDHCTFRKNDFTEANMNSPYKKTLFVDCNFTSNNFTEADGLYAIFDCGNHLTRNTFRHSIINLGYPVLITCAPSDTSKNMFLYCVFYGNSPDLEFNKNVVRGGAFIGTPNNNSVACLNGNNVIMTSDTAAFIVQYDANLKSLSLQGFRVIDHQFLDDALLRDKRNFYQQPLPVTLNDRFFSFDYDQQAILTTLKKIIKPILAFGDKFDAALMFFYLEVGVDKKTLSCVNVHSFINFYSDRDRLKAHGRNLDEEALRLIFVDSGTDKAPLALIQSPVASNLKPLQLEQ